MALTPCRRDFCGRLAEYRGYCRVHAQERDRSIIRAGRPIYKTKRWQVLRKHQLHEQSLCERCGDVATDVHHKHGVDQDPWSPAGLESLCHGCHSQETRREQLA